MIGDAMRPQLVPWLVIVALFLVVPAALAATETVVLSVEGMTCGS